MTVTHTYYTDNDMSTTDPDTVKSLVTLLYLLYCGVSLCTRRCHDFGIKLTLNTVEIDNKLRRTVHLATATIETQSVQTKHSLSFSTVVWAASPQSGDIFGNLGSNSKLWSKNILL